MRRGKRRREWVLETPEEIRVNDSLKYSALAFWAVLLRENNDNYGWINIPGTGISVLVGTTKIVKNLISLSKENGICTGSETVG